MPPVATTSLSDEPDRDQLLYKPGNLCEESEWRYIKMARTFRSFKISGNKQITYIEKAACIGDLLFDEAIINVFFKYIHFFN